MEIRSVARAMSATLAIALSAGCAGSAPLPPVPSPTLPLPHTLTPSPSHTPTPAPSHTPTPLPPTDASPLSPWEPLPTEGLPGPWVDDVAFATPTTAFVVADRDVYRSEDGGRTWTLSFSIYRGLRSLAVSPAFATDRTVFAADGRSLVFRSTDGGGTWEEVSRVAQVGGASDADVWLSISPAYPADPTLWAAVEGGVAYRSTDGGLTWEPFDPGFELDPLARLIPNPDYPANPTLELVDPTAVGDVDLPDGLSAPPMALAVSDGVLLLGTMRGLYRSTDGGATWTGANAGLPASAVGAVAVAADGAIYAGVNGELRLFQLRGGDVRWEPLGPLPEGDFWTVDVRDIAVVGQADAAPVLVVTTGEGFCVSRDGGLSWGRTAGDGLPPVRVRRLGPLFTTHFVERGVAHLVYSGRIYRTADGGDSWTRVEGVLGVKKLLEAPDGRLIALARGAVYEWDPAAGAEWVRHAVGGGFGGEPIVARFVSHLLAVAVMDDDVYLSEDGGRDWARIGRSELESASGYLISPRFDADRAIYAQQDTAILVSTEAGSTWVDAGQGLPVCEYDSPECGLELLTAWRSGDAYTLYARVRHDFHTRLWRAHTKEN
jgi:photosystem II stability/assembly factor-like uncharacterized protein